MRLCQIVPSLEARHGGPSKSVRELAGGLAAAGHEVELLTTSPGGPAQERDGRLEVRQFRRDWPARFCPSAGLRRRLAEIEPEIIHEHSLWLRPLHYARAAARRRRTPLVVSPRGMMSAWAWHHHRGRKWVANWLIHPGALAAVSGWHATSPAEAEEVRALGFRQPVCVAPNGISAPAADSVAAAADHWLQACPAAAQAPVALFFSRFHRKKRVIELIDLWLEHAPRDWLLLLVGIPQDYTPETLDEYVGRYGGAGRIAVFSGAGRPPPYAVASLFLLPSHNENFGLVVGEALAHGVPALVTDTTPWSELNTRGGGWCVPWSEYAAALQKATAESPEQLRARGEAGREWALREYSWEKPARLLGEFYRELRA
jgi:glycosyltransferase involved in cell wall biosynthesis